MSEGKAGKATDGLLDHILEYRERLSAEYRADLGWRIAYIHGLAAELDKTTLTTYQRRVVDEMLAVLTPDLEANR